jgi:hypothetical protein
MQCRLQCDQRKPGCLRCQKSGHLCPGYRDLDQVIFRDESERILRQVRRSEGSSAEGRLAIISTSSEQNRSTLCSTSEFPASSHFWPAIFSPILPAAPDLGAHFFFLKYTSDEPPFPTDRAWLAESYHASCGGQAAALRASIEAVGMAALSNVCHSPRVEDQSKRQYHQALAATNHALSDPVQAVADTTLMAVILLGLFEVCPPRRVVERDFSLTHVFASASTSRPGIAIALGPPTSKGPRRCSNGGAENNSPASVAPSSSSN